MLYLSPTEEGSIHDKAIADEYPLALPAGCVLKQDLGFLGHRPVGVIIEQPFKKPKSGDLTFSQALYNKIFASTRIIIEHANSGIKRVRMLKDTLRIKSAPVRDTIRVVACGLHNLRVLAINGQRAYQQTQRASAYI